MEFNMESKKIKGFTLMEVMIVVAIIAIIVAVALPSYQQQVLRTNRTDGWAMMHKMMQHQERFFTNNLTYTTNLTQLGYGSATNVATPEGRYTIAAAACGGGITECVQLTATAQAPQTNDTSDGGPHLSLNSLGVKTGPEP